MIRISKATILDVLKHTSPRKFVIQGGKPRAFEYWTIPGHQLAWLTAQLGHNGCLMKVLSHTSLCTSHCLHNSKTEMSTTPYNPNSLHDEETR